VKRKTTKNLKFEKSSSTSINKYLPLTRYVLGMTTSINTLKKIRVSNSQERLKKDLKVTQMVQRIPITD
jgi:hypothetical protein